MYFSLTFLGLIVFCAVVCAHQRTHPNVSEHRNYDHDSKYGRLRNHSQNKRSVESEEGYYWRNITGEGIPRDVITVKSKFDTFFIGQGLHVNSAGETIKIPLEFFLGPSGSLAFRALDGVRRDIDSLKMLCTHHPERITWEVVMDVNSFASKNRDKFVVGGHDGEFPQYIGEVTKLGQLYLGIVTIDRKPKGLTFILNDGTTADFTADNFSILTYS